jgi:hypothetical protein
MYSPLRLLPFAEEAIFFAQPKARTHGEKPSLAIVGNQASTRFDAIETSSISPATRCRRSRSSALGDPNLGSICAARGPPLWEQAAQFHWDDIRVRL